MIAIKGTPTENLTDSYQKLIDDGLIENDSAQRNIIEHLHEIQDQIISNASKKDPSLLNRIFLKDKKGKQKNIKGCYIHGDVGRGKSMIMDLFFNTTNIPNKRRVHFHSFMVEVHNELYQWRIENSDNPDLADPIVPLAERISSQTKLLCFDEFQVRDICDAMILSRLFSEMFRLGIVMIITSNCPPDELYKNGLQRESFLPFIDLLKQNVEEIKLSSQGDYRLSKLKEISTVYKVSSNEEDAESFLELTFKKLSNNAIIKPTTIEVKGRKILLERTSDNILWSDFKFLCDNTLGAGDYIEIAKRFKTILLSGIPKFTRENANECKRFITLIDELYEHKTKLICTAVAAPHYLYAEGNHMFEFQRTASRLVEMQSEEYINS